MDRFTMVLDQLVAQTNKPVPVKKLQSPRVQRQATEPKEKAPKGLCVRCPPALNSESDTANLCSYCYAYFFDCKAKQKKKFPLSPDLTVPEFVEKHPRRGVRKSVDQPKDE